jgi:hypothetical protein
VAVQNSGYGDGIVYPAATLKIAGAEIRLIQVAAQDITRGDASSRTLHRIVPSKQIVESLFLVDRIMTNAQSNQILDEIISRRNSSPFVLDIDSPIKNRFDLETIETLEKIVEDLVNTIDNIPFFK